MNDLLPDVRAWLLEGIPLTLLIDLLDPNGPGSDAIYTAEPADVTWIVAS